MSHRFGNLEKGEVNEGYVVTSSELVASKGSVQLLEEGKNLFIEVLSSVLCILILREEGHLPLEVGLDVSVDSLNLGGSDVFLSSGTKQILSVGLVDSVHEDGRGFEDNLDLMSI